MHKHTSLHLNTGNGVQVVNRQRASRLLSKRTIKRPVVHYRGHRAYVTPDGWLIIRRSPVTH